MESPEMLNQSAVAAELGISARTLEKWRVQGGGPPFLKVGRKTVRYRRADVLAWLEGRTVASPSEAAEARKAEEEARKPKPGEVWETSTGAVLIYLAAQGPPPLAHHIFVLESGNPELVEVREDRSGWTKLADSPEAYYRAKIEAERIEQGELFTRAEVKRACQFACARWAQFISRGYQPSEKEKHPDYWHGLPNRATNQMIAERAAKGKGT